MVEWGKVLKDTFLYFKTHDQRGARTVILGPFQYNIRNWNKLICVILISLFASISHNFVQFGGFWISTIKYIKFYYFAMSG